MKIIIHLDNPERCDGCPLLSMDYPQADGTCPFNYTDPAKGIFKPGLIPVDWEWDSKDREEYPCHPRPHQCIANHGE